MCSRSAGIAFRVQFVKFELVTGKGEQSACGQFVMPEPLAGSPRPDERTHIIFTLESFSGSVSHPTALQCPAVWGSLRTDTTDEAATSALPFLDHCSACPACSPENAKP
jgi:hypothetical protein